MKRLYILILSIMMVTTACQTEKNPLLKEFKTPFQTPPFDQVVHEHYIPAFQHAISLGLADIDAIVASKEAPTFENTIEALSYSGELLSRVSSIFFNISSAETDEQIQQIAREVSPMLSDFGNDILFNEALFARVKAVYEQSGQLSLNPEQQTLLEKTYKQFARNGANLGKEEQERLREISRELSQLSLQFSDNVLAETNAYLLHLTDAADVSGLPKSQLDAAAQLAQSRGLEGWAFTLHAPSFGPFLQYADNRELRRQVFMAFSGRASQGNEYDNRDVLMRIANLRLERAALLGYETHAHFVLEERMAETPVRVMELLQQLLTAARPAAENEVVQVQQMAKEMGADFDLMPWDWSYFSEKLRQKLYDFDQELLRPYFELSNATKGVFDLTNRLWGLTYVRNHDIPVYHSDVEAYEVYDAEGKFLSVLFLDFFPREGKRQGAWMTSYLEQHRKEGVDVRPHISVVCNFSKPTQDTPSLLTFNEFSTYLHEFGHVLHGMLSDVTYKDLSGTSVYWDFVELPSMIMENWALEKEFLDMFATHYLTGERIPSEMIDKIIESRNFNAGYGILRQLGFGFNDMAWHTIVEPVSGDPRAFERDAMKPAVLLPLVDNTMVSTTFSHIFAGGYSAGYYSYKWSEVLAADAFELFKENGIFDKATANSFREHVLSKGGSEHPMMLYRRFRGQEPSVEALLRKDGLL